MILQTIWEGLGLGALLVLVCAVGIRKEVVGMVHLYSLAVQQRCVKLGLTSPERIRRNSLLFKAVCVPGYIAYTGLRRCGERRKRLRSGLLAAAGHLIRYESHGPLFDRWLLGGSHERMDDPRNRGSEAVHHCKRQAEKMAFRYGRYGSHSGGAGGNYDSTVTRKNLPSAAFSGFLPSSATA